MESNDVKPQTDGGWQGYITAKEQSEFPSEYIKGEVSQVNDTPVEGKIAINKDPLTSYPFEFSFGSPILPDESIIDPQATYTLEDRETGERWIGVPGDSITKTAELSGVLQIGSLRYEATGPDWTATIMKMLENDINDGEIIIRKDSTVRGEILLQAKGATEGDRNRSYGNPSPNMACFARMVDTYVKERYRVMGMDYVLNDVDGGIIMDLCKTSRIAVNQQHWDNYVDKTAYGAIAGECAFPEGEPQ